MTTRWTRVGLTALLLCGCARTMPTSTAPRPGSRYSSEQLTGAAQVAIEAKQRTLATRGPKSFDQPAEAHEFFMEQRLSPWQPVYPWPQVAEARADIALREQASGIAAADAITWTWLGPGNRGGRTRAFAIDPGNPDVMYAGGVAGGIWKSVDGGASWDVADDLLINLAVTSIVMDPDDSSVLYAGTGEGVLSGRPGVRGLGIFKSTDAGASWTQLEGTVEVVPASAFHYVNEVVVSPNDSNRIYAATRTGVWRSLDAGQTWSVVISNPRYLVSPTMSNGSQIGCTDLALRSDTSPDVVFAAFGSFESDGLFRSDDGGDTWIAYTTGTDQGRMSLAFAPSDNDILYVLMANNGSTGQTGQLINVFRSDDGGDTFVPRVNLESLTGPWLLSNLILATGCREGGTYSQGWYDNIIVVDPVDPDIVWVGGVDIFRSDDGGVNWGISGYWIFYLLDPPPPSYIHPDHHNIVFHPQYDGASNQTMYVTNDGGLFRTTNARAPTSQEDCPLPGDEPLPEIAWESLNNNYGVTQFYHGDSAHTADVFIGGCQDNGTNRVQAVGTPNAWDIVFGGDGGYTAVDPTNADVMYVEYQGFPTIQKSVDGGETFSTASTTITDTDGLFMTPVAMDQNDPDVLWTGGRRPWRTTNAALVWQPVGPDFAGPDRISAIGIAPSDDNVVYLGFDNGYVARTTQGLSADPGWEIFVDGLYGAWVSSVTVDPQDPDVTYLTYSTFGVPHVLRTTDGGQNWTPIDGIDFEGVPDIPAHWVAVRPCDSQQLFVGTELGVFMSTDSGESWTPVNAGLAHTVVEALDWKDDDTLVAFTHGRGAFMTTLGPCGCPWDLDADGVVAVTDFLALLSAWGPNPGHPADFDGDGEVGVTDFLALLGAWGPC
jgi:photosystem II stability/assembly factor-like uncharacterized protein